MAFLYVLCEGECDDLFLDRLCERVAGRVFEREPVEFRVRPGSSLKTVLADTRLLLNKVRNWTVPQEIAVIICIDNDRAPGHPGGVELTRPRVGMDRKKAARYPAMIGQVEKTLGADRSQWPVDVAVAMPVEMIEAWALALHEPARAPLPPFKRAEQPLARLYYGGTPPPPQLRDLCDAERAAKGQTLEDFFWNAAEGGDLDAACAASPSLRMFLDEVRAWRCAGGGACSETR